MSRSKRFPIFFIFFILIGGFSAFGQETAESAAESGSYGTEVNGIADELRCPICQGLSVKESDTVIARNMKDRILEQLNEGKTKSQILDFFQERYGEWILRKPKKEGFNLLLWLLPFGAVAAAGAFAFFRFRKWSAGGDAEVALSDAEDEKFNRYFG